MTKSNFRKLSAEDINIMKFFVTYVIASLVVFGYSYADEYFRNFGLSLPELNIGYIEATLVGVYLLQDLYILGVGLSGLLGISIGLLFILHLMGGVVSYILAVIAFIAICAIAAILGSNMASRDSARIIQGDAGRAVYCVLKDDGNFPKSFHAHYTRLAESSMMRKIYETRRTMYLAVVTQKVEGQTYGQYLSISKSDISYCRVLAQ